MLKKIVNYCGYHYIDLTMDFEVSTANNNLLLLLNNILDCSCFKKVIDVSPIIIANFKFAFGWLFDYDAYFAFVRI